jgi:hypothetical protein
MNVIRQVGAVQLNQGYQMAIGLYNLFNTETQETSYWFDHRTKDELMQMSDENFLHEARVQFEVASIDDKIYHQ